MLSKRVHINHDKLDKKIYKTLVQYYAITQYFLQRSTLRHMLLIIFIVNYKLLLSLQNIFFVKVSPIIYY